MAKNKGSPPRTKAPIRAAGKVLRKSAVLSSTATTKWGQRPSPQTTRCQSVGPTKTNFNKSRSQERPEETVYSARVTHRYTTAETAAPTDTISETSTQSPSAPVSVVSRRTSSASQASDKDGPTSVQPACTGKELRLVGIKQQRGTETHIQDKLGCAGSITDSSGQGELRNNVGDRNSCSGSRQKEFNETNVSRAGSNIATSNTVRICKESRSPHRQAHIAKISSTLCDDQAQDSQRLLQMLPAHQSDTDGTQDQRSQQHHILLWRQQVQQQPEGEGEQQRSHQKQGWERYREHHKCEQLQREPQQQRMHEGTVTERPQECARGKAQEQQASGERNTVYMYRCGNGTNYGSKRGTTRGYSPSNCLRIRPLKLSRLGTEADPAGLSERWKHRDRVTPLQLQVEEHFDLLEPAHGDRKPSLPALWSIEEKCPSSQSTFQSRGNLPLSSEESAGKIRRGSCEKNAGEGAYTKSNSQPLQTEAQSHLWGFTHRLDHILDKLLQSQWTAPRDRDLYGQNSDGETVRSDASVRSGNTQDFDPLKTAEDSRGKFGKASTCAPVQTTANGLTHSQFGPMFDLPKVPKQTTHSVEDGQKSRTRGAPALEDDIELRMPREIGHKAEKNEEDLRQYIEQHTSARCLAISREPSATSEHGTRLRQRETKLGCLSPLRVVPQPREAGAVGMSSSPNASRDINESASRSFEREDLVASCHTFSIKESLAFPSCHADEARELELQDCSVNEGESDRSSHSLEGASDVGEAKRRTLVRQARMFPAVRGVYFDTRSGNLSWRCSWKTDGKKRSRSWSVLKFGMEGARAYAIAERLRHHSKACHTDDVARDFLRCFQKTKLGPSPRCGRSDTESPTVHTFKPASDSYLPSAASIPETERRADTNCLKSSLLYYPGQLHSRGTLRQPPSPSASTLGSGAKAASNFNTLQCCSPQHEPPRGTANEAALSDHGPERVRRALVQTNTSQDPRNAECLGIFLKPQLPVEELTCSFSSREDTGNGTPRQATGAPQLLKLGIDSLLTTRERKCTSESLSSNATTSPSGTSGDTGQATTSRALADEPARFPSFSDVPASPRESQLSVSLVMNRLNSASSTNKTGNCGFNTVVQETLHPSSGGAPSPRESGAAAESTLEGCSKRRKEQLYHASPVFSSRKVNATRYPCLTSSARQFIPEACILSRPKELQRVSVPEANKDIQPAIVATGKQLTHRFHHGYCPPGGEQKLDSSAADPRLEATRIRCRGLEYTSATAAGKATSVASNEEGRGGGCQGNESQEEKKEDWGTRQAENCNKGAGICKRGRETRETPGRNVYLEEHMYEEEAQSQSSSMPHGWPEMRSECECAPPAIAAPTAALLSCATPMCVPAATALKNNRLAASSNSLPTAAAAPTEAADSVAAATQRSDWTETQESLQHQDASGRESAPVGGREGAQRNRCEKLRNSTSLKSAQASDATESEYIEGEIKGKELCTGEEEGVSTGNAGRENAKAKRSRWHSQCSISGAAAAESQSECCSRASAQQRQPKFGKKINAFLCGRGHNVDCGGGVTDQGQCDVGSGTGKPTEVNESQEQRGTQREALYRDSTPDDAPHSMALVSINSLPPKVQQHPTGVEAVYFLTDTSVGAGGQLLSLNEASDSTIDALLCARARMGTPTSTCVASDTQRSVVYSEHLQNSIRLLTNKLRFKVAQRSGDVPAFPTSNRVIPSSQQCSLTSERLGEEALHDAGSTDDEKVHGEGAHVQDQGDTGNAGSTDDEKVHGEGAHVQDQGDTGKAGSEKEGGFCHAGSRVPAVLSGCAAALPDAAATDRSEKGVGGKATVLRGAGGPQTTAPASAATENTRLLETYPPNTAPAATTAAVPANCDTAMKTGCAFVAVGRRDNGTHANPDNEAASFCVLSSTEDLRKNLRERWDACSGKFVSVETAEERTGKSEKLSVGRLSSQREDPLSAWKYWTNVISVTAVPLPHATMTKTCNDDTPTTAPSPPADDSSTEGGSVVAGGSSLFEKGKNLSFPAEAAWEEEEEGFSPVVSSEAPWRVKEDNSQTQKMGSSDHGETVGERQDSRDRTAASSTNKETPDAGGQADGRGNGEEVAYEGLGCFGRKDAFMSNSNFRNEDYLKRATRGRNGIDSSSNSNVRRGGSNSENSIRRVVLVEALLKLKESLVELLQLSSRAKASGELESTQNPVVNLPLILMFSHNGESNALQQRIGRIPACSAKVGALDGGSEIQGKTATWCIEVFDELLDTLRLGGGPRAQEALRRKNDSKDIGDEAKDIAKHKEKADAFFPKREKGTPGSVDELEKTAFLLLSGFLHDIFSAPALLHYKNHALLAALITCFLNWKRLQNP